MARQQRFRVAGIAQHVIQRGNDRQACFFQEDDRRTYLRLLGEAAELARCAVHAYVLMTNHVHLLVTPNIPDGVSRLLQSLGRRYVQRVNARYDRTGTLWEGRYKATVVDSDAYLLAVYRYVELNPVRAGMVGHPHEYRWSSHRANAGGTPRFPLLGHPTYLALGQSVAERGSAYRRLFDDLPSRQSTDAIREATQRGWPLGGDPFHAQIESVLGRRLERNGWGGPRKRAKRKRTSSSERRHQPSSRDLTP